jgi:hypothetical protein
MIRRQQCTRGFMNSSNEKIKIRKNKRKREGKCYGT